MQEKQEKKVVIREGLVHITGNYIKAVYLGQFLYWTERVRDFDAFIREEKTRDSSVTIPFTHGWIYKTASELNEETMMDFSHVTVRKYVEQLIDDGFLEKRHNPTHQYDQTYQYRVNVRNVQIALEKAGFALEGYRLLNSFQSTEVDNPMKEIYIESSKNLQAIPDITSEITTEIILPQKSSEPKQEIATVVPVASEVVTVTTKYPAIERRVVLKELEEYFSSLTNIPLPKRETNKHKKAGAAMWWQPLWDMFELSHDLPVTKRLIEESVKKLKSSNLTIASPKSILQTSIAIFAELTATPEVSKAKEGKGVYL